MITAIEIWPNNLGCVTLLVKDGDGVREVLAEALYNATPRWKDPAFAVRMVIEWINEEFANGPFGTALYVGAVRDQADETLMLDFTAQNVIDIADNLRVRGFNKWIKEFAEF